MTLIVPPDEHAAFDRRLEQIKHGGPLSRLECLRLHKDGRLIPVSITISPIRDAGGRMVGVSSIHRDITERRQMEAQVAAYQRDLQSLASELVLAEERERQRLAIDLHDDLCQLLVAANMKLGALRGKVADPAQVQAIEDVEAVIRQADRSARTLTFQLSPPSLHEDGLVAALEWLGREMRNRYHLQVLVEDDGQPKPMDERVRVLLFRSLRELLVNVAKYAQVDHATVCISREGHEIVAAVRDEGVGFDPSQRVRQSGCGGFGLFSIRERLRHLGGEMVTQSAPGEGTTVTLRVPLPDTATVKPALAAAE